MLKRTLFFSTPYCLSLRNGQMIIHTHEAPDQRKSIPIEDIGFVVLEDQQTSITMQHNSARRWKKTASR